MTKSRRIVHGPAYPRGKTMGVGRGLLLGGILAALAGLVDAVGYLHFSGLFLSFMSGNSTQFAVALAKGHLAEAEIIGELIALFVLGAAFGQMVADFTGRWHMVWILAGVAILLAGAAMIETAFQPIALAMGALNASMQRAGNIPISLTYVTGVLVRLGQGLGDFITRRSRGWNWLAQATPWVGMIAGATFGAVGYGLIGERMIWAAVVLAAILAACAAAVAQPD
jgi:uncharacterized membrane protein YoaK (UPF0700 family)